MKRLLLTIIVVLLFILSGCALVPDELHFYGERTDMGRLGTVPTIGGGVTYKLKD